MVYLHLHPRIMHIRQGFTLLSGAVVIPLLRDVQDLK